MIKKMFYDLETTGVNQYKHSIIQLSAWMEYTPINHAEAEEVYHLQTSGKYIPFIETYKCDNGTIIDKINLLIAPHPKAKIEPEALTVIGKTEEELRSYPDQATQFKYFLSWLIKHCQRFEKKDLIYTVGFNNAKFDNEFLSMWFKLNNNDLFPAFFQQGPLDVMVRASQYLLNRRDSMPSFKLKRVAMTLGIDVDKTKLHDAEYDLWLTYQIYKIVTHQIEEL